MSVFATCVLITSNETLLADRAVAARVREALGECPEAELYDLFAASLDASQFVQITGGSLLSTHSVVTIRNLGDLPAELHERIVDEAKNPHLELCLTLVHEGGNKGSGLVNKLRKAKVPIQKIESPKVWELPDFVMTEARAANVKITRDGAQEIVDALGTDMASLASAVAQLAADWPGSSLTSDVIKQYFKSRAKVNNFSICDDVLNGHTAQALEKIRWANQIGVNPVQVVSAFASGLRSLGKYLDARDISAPDSQIAKMAGVPPWKLRDLSRQARYWKPSGVASAIIAVAKADAEVKGAGVDPQYALEKMALTVASARNN